MAGTTYTSSLRLTNQPTGGNANTWGDIADLNFEFLDDALGGVAPVDITGGSYTLTVANGAADEARAAIVKITGSPTSANSVIIPAVQKQYIVHAAFTSVSGGITVKTNVGSGVAFYPGQITPVYCDGVSVWQVSPPELTPTVSSGQFTTLTTYNDTTIGLSATSASEYRTLLVQNLENTNTSSGSIIKIRTMDTTGLQTADLVLGKTKNGAAGIYNTETSSGAFLEFGVGAARMRFNADGTLTGTGVASIRNLKRTVITATGSYTPTSGLAYADVEVQGAGGGGGGARNAAAGGAGGAGAYTKKLLTATQVNAALTSGSLAVTIGVGGTAGGSLGTNGGDGSLTSFGALLIAGGGKGGYGADNGNSLFSVAPGGRGGTVTTGGDISVPGPAGDPGMGGYSNGNYRTALGANGGTSLLGGGGGAGTFGYGGKINPQNGQGYGSGGGSAGVDINDSQAGATGANGVVIVTEYLT